MKEITNVKLVCGKMCMPCNLLKEWLTENNVEVDTMFGEDNMDFCRFYQVRKTPSLVITWKEDGSDYEGYEVIDDVEKIKEYLLNR